MRRFSNPVRHFSDPVRLFTDPVRLFTDPLRRVTTSEQRCSAASQRSTEQLRDVIGEPHEITVAPFAFSKLRHDRSDAAQGFRPGPRRESTGGASPVPAAMPGPRASA